MKLEGAARTHPLYVMTAFCAVFYLLARYAPGFNLDERAMLFVSIGPISIFMWLLAAVSAIVGDDGL